MVLLICGILLCLLLSAFFSSSEMSYSSANRIRLENLQQGKDRKKAARAALALRIIDRFEDTLGAILIGNNLVNIAASSLASVLLITATGSDRYAWAATLGLTVLVILFGETIPKITAKKQATVRALHSAYCIRAISILLWPVVKVVVLLVRLLLLPFKGEETEQDPDTAAEEAAAELTTIVEQAEEEGVLDEDQSELITAAIDFSEISAYEVMTARVDVDAIDIDDPWAEVLAVVDHTSYSRLPVYEETPDNIIGVLHLNAFLKAITDLSDPDAPKKHREGESDHPIDIRALLMPPCYVYKTTKLPQVMEQMRTAKQHLAVVSDEYGGTLGILTLEDVLEELVGEIWDEQDEIEEEVVERKTGEREIDGDLMLTDFLELYEIPEEELEAESDTVGGWCCEVLEHFPQPGEHFTWAFERTGDPEEPLNLTLTVLAMDGLRVEKVLVKEESLLVKED